MSSTRQAPDRGDSPAARRVAARAAGSFRPYLLQVIGVALLIVVTAGLGVVNPVLLRSVFDDALFPPGGSVNINLLWILSGVMIAVTVIAGALGIVQVWATNLVGQSVMRDLRDRLYAHLQRQSLGFFTATRTGEIQSRIANDVGGVRYVVTDTLSAILSNAVTFLSTLVAMAILSWELTVVSVIAIPVFAVMSRWVGERRRDVTEREQEAAAEVTAITQETLSISGIMLSKLFGRQGHEIERFHKQNRRMATLAVRRQMTGQAFFTVMQIFFSVAPVAVYLIAGYLLTGSGELGMTSGTLIAFVTLQFRLYFPIVTLMENSVEIQSSMAMFERIFRYLDIEPDIEDRSDAVAVDPHAVRGHVVFDSVRLTYARDPNARTDPTAQDEAPVPDANPARRWALDDVSFEVRPGRLAAIVGPSGAGKSSISYLISRLYDPSEGAVKIDGIDVRDMRLDSLAGAIGYVTQDSYLFHASLRDNLLYAKLDATQDEIESAARAAHVHDWIQTLPDGYDTIVGERGYRLSGGERQRIAIARVILRDPRILILDEATSALDTVSERQVQAALDPLMRGRTTIAIAHRLSTIMSADVIFVVAQGKVVERGSHAQLLTRGGIYAGLYAEQFRGGLIESYCEDGIILADGRIIPHDALDGTAAD